jgi:hypothetical protein
MALAGLLAGCVTIDRPPEYFRPARTVGKGNRVELPVTFIDDYPSVEVRINGEGPFHLLLDSGASTVTLSSRAAKLAHVQPKRFAKDSVAVSGGQGIAARSIALVHRLEAGGLSLENLHVLIDEAEASAAEPNAQLMIGDFDGTLGLAALYDVILEIDYPNKKVAVMRRGTERFPPERAVACDFTGVLGEVKLEIGGRTISAFVDTGSNGDFELTTLEDLPLFFPKQKGDGLAPYFVGGRGVREEWGQLNGDIRLGPVTWKNPVVTNTHATEAFLGNYALRPWKVVFDQHAGLIYFLGERSSIYWKKMPVPNPQFKLGYFCEACGTGVRLLEVDTGGAFDRAGLRVGDIITTIEGQSAVDWIYEHLPTDILKQPRLKLKAVRDGADFETIVQTQD